MKTDLTRKAIMRLPLPTDGAGPRDIHDTAVRQLCLTIRSNGTRSWTLRYRVGTDGDRRQRRLTLGTWPELSTEEAREKALQVRKLLAKGIDPVAWEAEQKRAEAEKRRAQTDLSFARLAERFVRHQRSVGRRKWDEQARILGLRARKMDPDFDRIGGGLAERWADRPLASIERLDVTVLLDDIKERGHPQAANKALAVLKSLFSWAVNAGYLKFSPVERMERAAPTVRRDRFLSDAELRLLWKAAEGEPYPRRQFAQLLILTGQRRCEVAGLRYDEIRGDVWHLPGSRSKNKHAHSVPLSPLAQAVIGSAPRHMCGLVMTSNGARPFGDFGKLKKSLDARMRELAGSGVEIPPWCFHDLRHTVLTGLKRLKVPSDTIAAVANHRTITAGSITSRYVHHDPIDEKREALERWAAHVESVISGESAAFAPAGSNVVSLTQAG